MLLDYKNGQGSIILRVKLRNSSVSTGAGLTGLTSASSGLRISTIADNESAATSYTAAGSTIETITTLGTYAAPTATKCRFKEVDATNHPGVYEIQIADARFAVSSAKSLLVSISGATNLAECDVVVPLRSVDPYDGVRMGMTALPNAAAAAAGGLFTRGTGAGQINQDANGRIDVNVAAIVASTDGATRLGQAVEGVAYGTAGASSTTTQINISSISPALSDDTQFNGLILKFRSDTTTAALRNQGGPISTGSAAGQSVTLSNALSTAPASGDTFIIS